MSSQPYDVPRLLVLHEVHRTGSLTAAAKALAYSTSAVSQQLSKLEKEVGLPLVDRHPRGVRLTDAGVALAEHAAGIATRLAAARADMEDFAELRRGRVRIATFPTFAASLMPRVILDFRERFRDIELTVRSTRIRSIREALARHEVDVATLWDYPWTPIEDPDLRLTTLMVERTMLLVPARHPLGGRQAVSLTDVAEEPWITRTNHPVAGVLRRVCLDAGFEPRVEHETNDYQELQGLVAAGLGVALAPRLAVTPSLPDVRVLSLRGNPAPRRILLARPADRVAAPHVEGLGRIFREVCGGATP